MSELMVMQENGQAIPAVRTEAASLMEVISRASSDPNTDVDKLERLMAMYERIKSAEAKRAYTIALRVAQREIPVISEQGKTDKTTYALWEDVNDVIKPILDRNSLNLSFRCGQTPEGRILVTGVLAHDDGHSEETTISLPSDTSGSKNAVQAVGSSTSYGKRYTAAALLNITSRGQDDDGKKAGKVSPDKPEPNPATAATKWAADAIVTVKAFKTDAELSAWQKKWAQFIADVRPLNEAAHKRLVEAIRNRSTELSPLNA